MTADLPLVKTIRTKRIKNSVACSSLQRWKCHCVTDDSLGIVTLLQQNHRNNNLATRISGLPVIVVDGATALAMVLIAYTQNTPMQLKLIFALLLSKTRNPKPLQKAEVRSNGLYECHCGRRERGHSRMMCERFGGMLGQR